MGTMFVNQAGSAGGVVEDLTDGRDRENLLAGLGIVEMPANVIAGLGAVLDLETAADVESLPDGLVNLAPEQIHSSL